MCTGPPSTPTAHWDGSSSHHRGSARGIPHDLQADAAAPLDGLLRPTGFLPATVASLGDQLAQMTGVAELGFLCADGSIIPAAWGPDDLSRLQIFAAPALELTG